MEENQQFKKSLELLKKQTIEQVKLIKEDYEIAIGPDKRILQRAKQSYEKKIEVHKQQRKKKVDKVIDNTRQKYNYLMDFYKVKESPVDMIWFFDENNVTQKTHNNTSEEKEVCVKDSEE